ncbi:MAG TPA: inositol monophosphatase [Planctomycetes bacterium]|nr:inositol monophosphatase [Planctomycetota bacterium]
MSLPLPPDLDPEAQDILSLLLRLGRESGEGLRSFLEARGSTDEHPDFKGRRELVTDADRESERLLVRGIREAFPEHAILAEEGVETPAGRADREARFCWVLDPLDGTTNFVHGHPHWSVSIGVLRDGRPWIGGIYAPMLGGREGGTFWYGCVEGGAFCNGEPMRVSRTACLREAVVSTGFSYNRNEKGVNNNLGNFGRMLMEVRGIRRCGSAAIDLALCAQGVYDAFWEMYLQPYDVAAGMALVHAAGGWVSDLGSGEDPLFGSEIFVTNGLLQEEMRPLLKGIRGEDPS